MQLNLNLPPSKVSSKLYMFPLVSASEVSKFIFGFKFVSPKLWPCWSLVAHTNIALQSEGIKNPTVVLEHKATGEMGILFTQVKHRLW